MKSTGPQLSNAPKIIEIVFVNLEIQLNFGGMVPPSVGSDRRMRASFKEGVFSSSESRYFFQKNNEEELQPLDFVLGLSKWQKSNLHTILQTFSTG